MDGNMLEHAKRIFTGMLDLCAIMIEEAIERSSGNSREDLEERLRDNAERAAQLALEKAALEDKLDQLRFNGPSLWKDEVDALRMSLRFLDRHNKYPDSTQKEIESIARLLGRCDHMPMTAAEMDTMAEEAIRECNPTIWDDPGSEVIDDDPYDGSWREAADNEGASIAAKSRGDDDDVPF